MSNRNNSVDWYKNNLKMLGIETRSNNKSYIIKKYHEAEKKIILIQAHVKGWIQKKKYIDVLAQDTSKLKISVNQSTLVGEPLTNIPINKLYFVKENHQYYGFDLDEIWEWVCKYNNLSNPYTMNSISSYLQEQIQRLHKNNNIIVLIVLMVLIVLIVLVI